MGKAIILKDVIFSQYLGVLVEGTDTPDTPTVSRPKAIRSKVGLLTDIDIANVTRIDAKMFCAEGYKTMIGWEGSRSDNSTRLIAYHNNKVNNGPHQITLRWGNNTYTFADISEPVEYSMYSDHCVCNGISYSYGSSANVTTNAKLELFKTFVDYSEIEDIDGTIYYVKLYNGDSLIHELLPYMDSPIDYGFEDTITGTKYNIYSGGNTSVVE